MDGSFIIDCVVPVCNEVQHILVSTILVSKDINIQIPLNTTKNLLRITKSQAYNKSLVVSQINPSIDVKCMNMNIMWGGITINQSDYLIYKTEIFHRLYVWPQLPNRCDNFF